MSNQTVVGVIGGTGLYQLEGLDQISEQAVPTPFGEPSGPIISGLLGDVRVIFIPRHCAGHTLLPSEINYRANIYALKLLGAQWVISVSAVGSLEEKFAPGSVVIPDQIIDFTRRRESTFFGNGLAAHVSLADPYCSVLSEAVFSNCKDLENELEGGCFDGATFVCMEGPAFSSRAESHFYRKLGAGIIGMTSMPEAKLAREAEMAYTTMAFVTDYDCWKEDEEAVEVAHVIERLKRNASVARNILQRTIPCLTSLRPSSYCSDALKNAFITSPDMVDPKTVERLGPIVSRYF